MHKKPSEKNKWDPYSVDCWYDGASHAHYQSYAMYKKEARAQAVSDTIYIKHKYITHPTVMPKDRIMQATKDLAQVTKWIHWVAPSCKKYKDWPRCW